QAKIKELEANQGLWKKFIDYIRTLLGLRKNSDYNTIIDHITTIALHSDIQGGLNVDRLMFEKKETEESEDNDKIPYYKLRTIEEKMDYTLNKIKDNLEQNIALYDYIIKTSKEPDKLEKYNDKLKELLSEIELLDKTKQWSAITVYVNQLAKNISSLEHRLSEEDMSDDNIKKTMNLYSKYLKSNAMVDSIQEFLSDAKLEKDLPITKEELKKIEDVLGEANSKYQKLQKDFLSFNKKAIFELFNDRRYAREVIYDWQQKLKKEHKELGIKENRDSWVARQLNTTYKDEVDVDVAEKAYSIVNDPAFDISTATKLFNSAINTNSDLIQVTQNRINQTRENIVERNRTIELELQPLFEE